MQNVTIFESNFFYVSYIMYALAHIKYIKPDYKKTSGSIFQKIFYNEL